MHWKCSLKRTGNYHFAAKLLLFFLCKIFRNQGLTLKKKKREKLAATCLVCFLKLSSRSILKSQCQEETNYLWGKRLTHTYTVLHGSSAQHTTYLPENILEWKKNITAFQIATHFGCATVQCGFLFPNVTAQCSFNAGTSKWLEQDVVFPLPSSLTCFEMCTKPLLRLTRKQKQEMT